MTYLVTGATGNLARQLIERLLSDGHRVVGLDLRTPDNHAGVEFVQGDITDTDAMETVVLRVRPDVVLHMASLLSSSSEADPPRAWRVNANASVALLEICRDNGVGRFFYPSTGATFGGPLPDTLPEDFPQWPQNVYGVTKVAVERAGAYYATRHGVDFRSLRLPMVISRYAPAAAVSAYASHAFAAAKSGEHFVFPVDPSVGISTIYVRDVVDGVFALLAADPDRLTRRVYNVHGFAATAGEMATEIARQHPGFSYEFAADPAVMKVLGPLPSVHADESARRDWGWNPRYGLAATTSDMLANA